MATKDEPKELSLEERLAAAEARAAEAEKAAAAAEKRAGKAEGTLAEIEAERLAAEEAARAEAEAEARALAEAEAQRLAEEAAAAEEAARAPVVITFRNRYPTQRVRLGRGRTIQFVEDGVDDEGKAWGVWRTTSESDAQTLRGVIARGGVPAWEEDDEEREAVRVLAQSRARQAAKIAGQAQAALQAGA